MPETEGTVTKSPPTTMTGLLICFVTDDLQSPMVLDGVCSHVVYSFVELNEHNELFVRNGMDWRLNMQKFSNTNKFVHFAESTFGAFLMIKTSRRMATLNYSTAENAVVHELVEDTVSWLRLNKLKGLALQQANLLEVEKFINLCEVSLHCNGYRVMLCLPGLI